MCNLQIVRARAGFEPRPAQLYLCNNLAGSRSSHVPFVFREPYNCGEIVWKPFLKDFASTPTHSKPVSSRKFAESPPVGWGYQ